MTIKQKAQNAAIKAAIQQGLNYLQQDPQTNLPKLLDLADKMSGTKFVAQRKAIRKAVEDPNDPHHPEVERILNDVDPGVLTDERIAQLLCLGREIFDVIQAHRAV